MEGTTTVDGGLTTGAGSTLSIFGNAGGGNATLEVAGGFTNNGLVELTDNNGGFGAFLAVDGGAFVNAAGRTVVARVGNNGMRSITLTNGATLNNQGDLAADGSLTLSSSGGSSVSNAGSFSVSSQRTLTVSGPFTNLAGTTLTGGSYSITGTLRLPGAVNTLAASMILNGTSPAVVNSVSGTNALGSLATVTGAGSLSGSVNFSTNTPVINSGTVRIGAGFSFDASAGFTNAAGGTLGGNGTIFAAVSGPGTLSPGFSPGNITIFGSITLGGELLIELDGSNPSSFDQMTVMGGVMLGGPLNLVPNFNAPVGTQFRIISNDLGDLVVGTFAGLPQGATLTASGQTFAINYTGGDGNDVVLTRVAAPRVTGVAVNAGQTNATQRSRLTAIAVTFDTQVTFAGTVAAAFGLSRIGGGAVGGFTATASVVGGVTVVTLTGFSGAETEFGSLADGRYSVLVRANQVSANGLALDGDGNGTGGDDYTLPGTTVNGLFRLYGDGNGDGVINALDFGQFRPAFGTAAGDSAYRDFLDFNGDGQINAFDFAQFRTRFGSSVP